MAMAQAVFWSLGNSAADVKIIDVRFLSSRGFREASSNKVKLWKAFRILTQASKALMYAHTPIFIGGHAEVGILKSVTYVKSSKPQSPWVNKTLIHCISLKACICQNCNSDGPRVHTPFSQRQASIFHLSAQMRRHAREAECTFLKNAFMCLFNSQEKSVKEILVNVKKREKRAGERARARKGAVYLSDKSFQVSL